jgi:hypothetical protein
MLNTQEGSEILIIMFTANLHTKPISQIAKKYLEQINANSFHDLHVLQRLASFLFYLLTIFPKNCNLSNLTHHALCMQYGNFMLSLFVFLFFPENSNYILFSIRRFTFYGLILSFTIAAKLSCCGQTFITDLSPMSCHIAFRMTQLGGVKQKSVIYDIRGSQKITINFHSEPLFCSVC